MREIKFRAWDKKAKEMLYLTGFKYFGRNGIQLFYNCEDEGTATRSLNVEDVELMQYTELKDKNGVEIYEGDIIKYNDNVVINGSRDHVSKVEYLIELGGYCFSMVCIGYGTINKAQVKALKVEVIGNIYENPELLEEGK